MSTNNPTVGNGRTFGGLVEECAARDIGRSKAFQLVRDGYLDTFKIGRRTYVKLDSLDSLPDQLANREVSA